MLLDYEVCILVEEGITLIRHITRIMRKCERSLRQLGLAEALLVLETSVQLLSKLLIRTRRQHARFVKQRYDSVRTQLDHVEHVLIIDEFDVRPIDTFSFVLFLLHLEDVLIEMLLKLLVGEVDAELLKRIHGEALKTVDIEDSDERFARRILTDTDVDSIDERIE